MAQFIKDYGDELKRYQAAGKHNPVILLVDNDDGTAPVYDAMRKFGKTKPTDKEPFVHIVGNLYLVATPLAAGQTQSMIEDAFGTLAGTLKLGGTSLNPDDKTLDDKIHYDKHFVSQYVKEKARQIDFRGFTEILTRLTAVINAHTAAKNPPGEAQPIGATP